MAQYLLERPFPLRKLLSEHYIRILQKFYKDKIETNIGEGYNTHYNDKNFEYEVAQKFIEVVKENFIFDDSVICEKDGYLGTQAFGRFNPIKSWVYCQNYNHSTSQWHSHINTSTINAVLYYNMPKTGGELCFDIFGTKFKVTPKPEHIYIFPYWAYHTPMPQDDDLWRVCVNLELMLEQRPLTKAGDLW